MEARPSYDEYFMEMAYVVAKRSTCLRRKVGAILVKDKHILSTGYNGAPKGLKHCSETGCLRKDLNIPSGERHELCRGLHAEQNAIIQAARFGIPLEDATLFCKMTPCRTCAMIIINAGIKRVVCEKRYHADADTIEMFKQAGIELSIMNDEVEKYDKQ